jgi:hypothetical protein
MPYFSYSGHAVSNVVALALLAALLHWFARAPTDPAAEARYLCRPVHRAVHGFLAVQSSLNDGARVVPAQAAFLPDQSCEQVAYVFLRAIRD